MNQGSHGCCAPYGIGVVISAPSGAGKTSLTKLVLSDPEMRPRFGRIISCTTRPPRSGETHGVDYWFLSIEEFEYEVALGAFLEYAPYEGNLYGTRISAVEDVWTKDQLPIFKDLEIQGALEIRRQYPTILRVFLYPTDMPKLEGRLRERPGMTEEAIRRRVDVEAPRELILWDRCCHVRIMSEHGRVARMREVLKPLMLEYLADPLGVLAQFVTDDISKRTLA